MVKMERQKLNFGCIPNRCESTITKSCFSTIIIEDYSRNSGFTVISPRGRAYQMAGVYFPGGLIRTLPEKIFNALAMRGCERGDVSHRHPPLSFRQRPLSPLSFRQRPLPTCHFDRGHCPPVISTEALRPTRNLLKSHERL